MTRNAQLVLDLIQASPEHLSAEQIYMTLMQSGHHIVLATVYNSLNSLYEQGLIRRVSVDGCPDRYDRTTPHDHLVCKGCGKLSDVTLKDLTESLQTQLDVEVLSYDLKISYLCPECKRKKEKERS